MSATYPTPKFRRTALAPAILGCIACLAGVAAVGGDIFTLIRYLVAIIAAIVVVFAWQAKHWWWLIALVPMVVLWNPVVPIELPDSAWAIAQYVGALVFVAAGVLIRVPVTKDSRSKR